MTSLIVYFYHDGLKLLLGVVSIVDIVKRWLNVIICICLSVGSFTVVVCLFLHGVFFFRECLWVSCLKYVFTFIAHLFHIAFDKTIKCSQFIETFTIFLNYAFYLKYYVSIYLYSSSISVSRCKIE